MTKGNSEPLIVEDAVVVDTLKGLYPRLEDLLQQVRETRGWIDELEGERGGKQNVIKEGGEKIMQEEEKKEEKKEEGKEEGKTVAPKLAALDEQLQKISAKLEITEMPDAQIGGTLVDGLIEKIEVMMQRVDMIGAEVRKLE